MTGVPSCARPRLLVEGPFCLWIEKVSLPPPPFLAIYILASAPKTGPDKTAFEKFSPLENIKRFQSRGPGPLLCLAWEEAEVRYLKRMTQGQAVGLGHG